MVVDRIIKLNEDVKKSETSKKSGPSCLVIFFALILAFAAGGLLVLVGIRKGIQNPFEKEEEVVVVQPELIEEEAVIVEPIVVEEPVVVEPIVEEPITIEEPVIEEPVIEEPVIEEPVVVEEKEEISDKTVKAILLAHSLIGGFSVEEALDNAEKSFNENQYRTLLNFGGEHYKPGFEQSCYDTAEEYKRLLSLVGARGLQKAVSISIKPSQLCIEVDPAMFESLFREIVSVAAEYGIGVELDQEEIQYRQITLDVFYTMLDEFKERNMELRIAHQAEFSDAAEIAKTISEKGGCLRLVRGKAYKQKGHSAPTEYEHLFLTSDDEIAESFVECAKNACPGLAIATSSKAVADAAKAECGEPQYQFLYGLPSHLPRAQALNDHKKESGEEFSITWYAIYGSWPQVKGYVSRRNVLNDKQIELMDETTPEIIEKVLQK
ncbi:hypothetical protein ADUPG1_012900 [Aduncisulcus paluster]|uniref:Proline dehydrogenase domain-containing protein n=1 Tax=Aduncisulcus paluster TaxID=2918883 RepID=A0ABQ5K126_9EUKA|nr:hypothetical protein ADUPG1_012900 [Aduncisulcus paluster]